MHGTSSNPTHTPPGKLGTFTGVFTPSILTILGIILFLRLGYVVGTAGLGRSLLIIALANTISILTSISLSAVATNMKVRGGGDYYLISRTLGKEFGGSIGLVLFLAQSVSIAFYAIGFAEATASFFPDIHHLTVQLIAAGAVAFLFIFAWQGSDWAARFQFIVMALLVAALVSVFVGGIQKWDSALLSANWGRPESGVPFWILFAIFFPAVTGFTQGVSMSGDLKNPGKSIPLGTFLAVGLSIVVYFFVALLFAATMPNATLAADFTAMRKLAAVGFLIDAGVIAATLSSAMASFMGAPRILQSLAADRIFTVLTPFAALSATGNPRRGVLLSAGIAFVTIALGQLNLVAGIVSMFFLISYGLLNYATYYEAQANSPSFRPRFTWFSPTLSLLGAVICLLAMLAIDLRNGLVAIALLLAIHQYIKRTGGPSRWADSTRSHHLQQVRRHLLAAGEDPDHPRDWRPQLLIFTQDAEDCTPILSFASWIEGGSGFIEAVQIIEGEGAVARKNRELAQKNLARTIAHGGYPIFPLAVHGSDVTQAMGTIIQSSGIGPLRPNTVVVNWMDQSTNGLSGMDAYYYVNNLRLIFRQKKNLIIFRNNPMAWDRLQDTAVKQRRIDIWWQGDNTSRLMLLLAHLMTRNQLWAEAELRVLPQGDHRYMEAETQKLHQILKEIRIEAEVKIVENFEADTIIEHSADTSFVFLPMRIEHNRILDPTGKSFERSILRLQASAIVIAAEDIDLDATPEEGLAAEVALATDQLQAEQNKAASAEKEATKKETLLETLQQRLTDLEEQGIDGAIPLDKRSSLRQEVEQAKSAADKTFRRSAKAKQKADDAAKFLEEMNPGKKE